MPSLFLTLFPLTSSQIQPVMTPSQGAVQHMLGTGQTLSLAIKIP